MFYEQDWLCKQIQMLVRFVAKVVFGKDTSEATRLVEESTEGTNILYRDIKELLLKGEICQAENLLFDNLDVNNKSNLAVAVEFYSMLNELSDEELEKHFFSRSEIRDGLKNVMQIYGLSFGNEFLEI